MPDPDVGDLVVKLTVELAAAARERDRLADVLDRARAALGGLDSFTVETMADQIGAYPPVIGGDARVYLARHLRESIHRAREILAEAEGSLVDGP